VVASIPDVYSSHARIYVDTESVLKPLLSGLTVNTDYGSEATMISRVMLAKPNLERVARATGLERRARNSAEHEAVIAGIGRRIFIESSPYDRNLYSISFQDTDREMTKRVVQTVLAAFVESALGLKQADSTEAQKFLQNQIREYEARLRESEDKLADFKRKNVGMMPGETGDYYSRLQAAQQRLEAAQSDLHTAVSKRDELMRQLEGEEPTVGLGAGSSEPATGTSIDAQIASYKARLDALLVGYTEKHPEVVAIKETIARLEAQRDQEAAVRKRSGSGVRSSAGASALNINPVYQSMRISLSQTELQLVELRNKVANEQTEVTRLKALVSTAPAVEAELKRLSRDYDVTRSQHQQLLQRLESARLSQEASTAKQDARFRLVEPPTVPLRPMAPNRLVFNVAVLFAGLAAGLGLAFVLHQFRPVFATREELETALGLPVFGAITLAPDAKTELRIRRQPWLVGACVGLLVVACGMAIVFGNRLPFAQFLHVAGG